MKIGILCEGEFSDKPVLEILLKDRFPGVDFLIRGVDKRVIFSAADADLANMFSRFNVERALILWDLNPVGKQLGVSSQQSAKVNRHEQKSKLIDLLCKSDVLPEILLDQSHRLALRYNLPFAQVNTSPNALREDILTLVCVCYEVDGWLLSDHNILCSLLSTASHPIRRLETNPGKPDECSDPTSALKKVFRSNGHFRNYTKHQHNKIIAREYVKQGKVDIIYQSSQSFRRVVDSIERWIRQ